MAINIDFYQVIEPQGFTLHGVLQNILATPVINRVKRSFSEHAVITELEEFHLGDGTRCWKGTIHKIRMNNIPRKGNLQGIISDIGLNQNEGVAEGVSFIYDPHPNMRVFAVQYNHYGTKTGGIFDYFDQFINQTRVQFDIVPILTTDALVRMRRQQVYRKIEVAYAVPRNPNEYVDANESTRNIIQATRNIEGGKIRFEVTPEGDRQSSLSLGNVRRMVRDLLDDRENVSTLKIYGKENDDSPVRPIDLLHDRMVEQADFRPTRQQPLTNERMYDFLETAYNTRRAQINAQFITNEV